MILKLEHTTTHQTYEYEVSDMNNGEKLYFRFDINTSNLDEGEYYLSIYDKGDIVCSDILKIGDYNPNTLQYSKGENTYINVTLDATIQGDKMANINTIVTNITPDVGYNAMSSVEVNAQPLFDEAFEEGNKIGFQDGKTIGEEIGYINGKEDGYQQGKDEWYEIGYQTGHNDGSEEGYENGFENGKQFQKDWMQSITITENGTYTREDGYNEVVVNVEDTNGSFDDGYNTGYEDGIAEGVGNAGEIIAETARVLDITENGTYYSRYSDIPEDKPLQIVKDGEYTYIEDTGEITGYFDDGTPFYGCGTLNGLVYKTEITPNEDTRLEFWYKGDGVQVADGYNVIIAASTGDDKDLYQVRYTSRNMLQIAIANSTKNVSIVDNVWTHILIEDKKIYINDEFIGELTPNTLNTDTFYINGAFYTKDRNANGSFGIIKIDDVILLPTPIGIIQPKEYDLSGNLIKTVNVNIQPKIDVGKLGIRLGYSSFDEIPENLDFSNVKKANHLFESCTAISTAPDFDTSKITDMTKMFYWCSRLRNIPEYDTSNVTNMNQMFYACSSLQTLPKFDVSKVTDMQGMLSSCSNLKDLSFLETWNYARSVNMAEMFGSCTNIEKCPAIYIDGKDDYYQGCPFWSYSNYNKFTDFGGFIGLKYSMDKDYQLKMCPNLTYQSCINVLNGLADVTELGSRKLKVHSAFIEKLTEEDLQIPISKGWVIQS